MTTTVKSRHKGLTGEGLLPSPPQAELGDRQIQVWLVGNGTSVDFEGGRYRKVKSTHGEDIREHEGETYLLGDGDMQISVPHNTLVRILEG